MSLALKGLQPLHNSRQRDAGGGGGLSIGELAVAVSGGRRPFIVVGAVGEIIGHVAENQRMLIGFAGVGHQLDDPDSHFREQRNSIKNQRNQRCQHLGDGFQHVQQLQNVSGEYFDESFTQFSPRAGQIAQIPKDLFHPAFL